MTVQRVMSAAALVLSSVSVLVSVWLWDGLRDEGKQRRDQSCRIDERQQKKEVDQLARTYDYLSGLSIREFREPINRAVLAQLSETEATAREDNAAEFCDEPGVGLPEPDPVVPVRPKSLR